MKTKVSDSTLKFYAGIGTLAIVLAAFAGILNVSAWMHQNVFVGNIRTVTCSDGTAKTYDLNIALAQGDIDRACGTNNLVPDADALKKRMNRICPDGWDGSESDAATSSTIEYDCLDLNGGWSQTIQFDN